MEELALESEKLHERRKLDRAEGLLFINLGCCLIKIDYRLDLEVVEDTLGRDSR